GRYGRRNECGYSDVVGAVLLDGGGEVVGRHVPAEVHDLETGAFLHHRHQVFPDVVKVALGGADDDDAEIVVGPRGRRDERLEQIEAGIHRAGGQEHLGHVVLVTSEFLADDVHNRNETLEDE